MSEEQLEALLGRPLTPIEETNIVLYLDIATQSLEELICTPIDYVSEEERIFDTRKGYSTAFIDIFHEVIEVKIDDEVVDSSKYSVRQWDKRAGSWYNSLVFDSKFKTNGEITVTAGWGFESVSSDASDLPADLQVLLAGLFDLITKKNKFDGTINSKQVEDFRISFNTGADLDDEFYAKYNKTISKYSLCDIGNIQHGKVGC